MTDEEEADEEEADRVGEQEMLKKLTLELTSFGIKVDVATKAQHLMRNSLTSLTMLAKLKDVDFEEVMESGGFTKGEANTIMAHLKKNHTSSTSSSLKK